jgi:uncharacterized protein YukE
MPISGAGGSFGVTYAGAGDAFAQLAQQNTRITTMLSELEAEVRRTLSYWEGSAQQMYTSVQIRWNQQAAHMGQQIAQRATVGNQALEGYSNSDGVAANGLAAAGG